MNSPESLSYNTIDELTESLKQLLEHEFELLRINQSEELEALQSKKSDILHSLSSIFSTEDINKNNINYTFILKLQECKNMHRRNEIFLTRKLNAVKSALFTLQNGQEHTIDQTYDRKGSVKTPWL